MVDETWNPDPKLICECGPDLNPGCALGEHEDGHVALAAWRLSIREDPETQMQLCSLCFESFLESAAEGLVLDRILPRGQDYPMRIDIDAEVWSRLSERQTQLSRERKSLVSLNDTIQDLLRSGGGPE